MSTEDATVLTPVTWWELEGQIRSALHERARVVIAGGATKGQVGPQQSADIVLSLSNLRGVEVRPDTGLAIAQCGSPIRQVERELLRYGFMLPFEPSDLGPLFGYEPWAGTIGGAFATNIAGSRRLTAGTSADNLVGCTLVTGQGDIRRFGVRHRMGHAAPELLPVLSGSWGIFGVMTEVTFRITPLPDETVSLVVPHLSPRLAIDALSSAIGATRHVTAAAFLDRAIVARLWSERLGFSDAPLTVVRIEGRQADLADQIQRARTAMKVYADPEVLPDSESTDLWAELQGLSVFQQTDAPLWRLTVPPSNAPAILEALYACLDCHAFVDWAGGLIWLETVGAPDAGASDVRRVLASHGGSGLLVRADPATRETVDCFQPLPHRDLSMLTALKSELDPYRLFNAGRVYAGL